ncbi:Thiamine-phosphate kinase [Alteripontixanthobacter maritimus]|uniref:Thiamine-monophosphate kinase n=1 Tax=Alteripontixanthobacter maritimus TaxID=2161824 RepID=A0A369Q6W8_9SPHN|nr:thiamine-phosphate kinase [Alteripontixanthobacter maritimus]RDC60464.1 Thiamine-phosphate kinase [Alteripontixanthobacter maritimus]
MPSFDERTFIAALRGIANHPAARGLGDDAAALEFGGETLILTHDVMVEGVHYLASQDMADVAWKLVATNLSDLAAMGAQPMGVLLGHMLGRDDAAFIEGLRQALTVFGVALLGGDTVGSGNENTPRAHGLTAIGRATHTPAPSRSGAQIGDIIWLSGPVGAAMMGFEAVRDATGEPSGAFRRPVPLLDEGRALAPHVTAMMDVSDGLLLDATRLAEASGVTLSLDRMAVPLSAPEARRDDALRWGDDYQLLVTIPRGVEPPIPMHAIGTVVAASDVPLLLDGQPPALGTSLGYEHGT